MRQVTMEAMEALLLRYRGRYTTVVGFSPTGWSHARSAKGLGKRGRRAQCGTVVHYSVPYSEHSSCAELRDFVEWFRPVGIIPSVGNDRGGPKCRAMLKLLTEPAPRGPMDAFARRDGQGTGGSGGVAPAQQQDQQHQAQQQDQQQQQQQQIPRAQAPLPAPPVPRPVVGPPLPLPCEPAGTAAATGASGFKRGRGSLWAAAAGRGQRQ